ncbi:MAG: 2-succinyl-5-enolpyruvyl-6-hydroxy-3-cyclohexene-1-carboxylic-acid synthase [Duncaniella sp.]|uniref:2-succinyl-5-enolpyruvyl-6-hydroxy-3- cyclohexene-1-carboxylic-acid synthase n=1 Tax=Duncaniella sp. TaxID=2518496 RepID=UPI0023CA4536|nr:2-succinyl-5-enolpyruvyl-6-hydroxy-3-cyclohexene-1-carboxylic-acid synthase [Duncaniella sp.]MDE6091298.1 2-succinyl-5-enolpyruvyl-6-hydroxy-3-cyclohexene-1-carboxylic-acid synthase [Duncaniella sp.]
MYSNNPLVLELIALLKEFGIRKIVVSPGGRHVQFVISIEKDPYFQLYSVVDERSAAFFALGLIQETSDPVAVACSSGTACMNYGSAMAEAYYQHLPLVVLSSDRLPHFLNQGEEQMYDQLEPFKTITKCSVQLPEVNNELDKWLCNRLINEALINLNAHGKGPVHINFPMRTIYGDNFGVIDLPKVRKINFHTYKGIDAFKETATRIKGKRVMIIWGQSVHNSTKLVEGVTALLNKCDSVLLSDYMSNCQVALAYKNTLSIFHAIKPDELEQARPDILITIGGNQIYNGELKSLIINHDIEHWSVDPTGEVCDPFHCLTDIFQMEEYLFFSAIESFMDETEEHKYSDFWTQFKNLPEPPTENYNEFQAIGWLIHALPEGADLQLANSNTIRMAQFFNIPKGVRVNCNRGVNGIDGSMSTAIGFSSVSSRPVFYITGELSFFYDMNSLWIKHISPQIRILLINNDGGAFMYHQKRIVNGQKSITLAAENQITAKGWVESLGFTYLSAHNSKELKEGIDALTCLDTDSPIILEVFTDLVNDGSIITQYYASLDRRSFADKVQGKLSRVAGKLIGK